METNIAQVGQKADLYLIDLYPQIAKARHHLFLHGKRVSLPDFNPMHAIDCLIARRQQARLRKLQTQVLAIAAIRAGEPRDPAGLADRREQAARKSEQYWRAEADFGIRHARIQRRVARHAPVLRCG